MMDEGNHYPDGVYQEDLEGLSGKDTFVVGRIRPLLPKEDAQGLFRVARSLSKEVAILLPSTNVANKPKLEPSKYRLDGCFGPADSNEIVYAKIGAPLVLLALNGGAATFMAYGQTGSGKTYTVSALTDCMIADLFNPELGVCRIRNIALSAIEIIGNKAYNLLSDNGSAACKEKDRESREVFVREDAFGKLHWRGAVELPIPSAAEMRNQIKLAMLSRKTSATLKNDASSRSHLILRVRVTVPVTESSSSSSLQGELFFGDLAGSENRGDAKEHDAERLTETKLINTSLMTLKDCMKARAYALNSSGHVFLPFRKSLLTLCLKDSFELAVARPVKTVIMATVSPSCLDASHSLMTLRYAAAVFVTPKQRVLEVDMKDPINWTRETCHKFLQAKSQQKVQVQDILPAENDSGRALCEMPQAVFVDKVMQATNFSEDRANTVYINLWKRIVDARSRRKKQVMKVRSESNPLDAGDENKPAKSTSLRI